MSNFSALHTIDNIGFQYRGRHFRGYPKTEGRTTFVVEPRAMIPVSVRAGDLLHFDLWQTAGTITLLAMKAQGDARGQQAHHHLGLTDFSPMQRDGLDMRAFDGWVTARGGNPRIYDHVTLISAVEKPVILKADTELTVWLGNPVTVEALTAICPISTATVMRQRLSAKHHIPDPLGHVIKEILVPRGSARAYALHAGQKTQIIDLEGQQCSDFQALNANALEAGNELMIDSTATRSMVRQAYPRPGLLDKFYDIHMRPMLKVVQDTCGRHDTFGLACTARGYEERGFPGHLNCSDNMSHALSPFGVHDRRAWPAINLFWSTWLNDQHHIQTEEGWSRPGDYVVMEALQDLVCVSTACPDDIDPINGWNPTDILVRIYDTTTAVPRSVGYREKEDAPMLSGEYSAFHERLAPLTEHFAPNRDLWSPVTFPAIGTQAEYWACRENVTLQDMSGLRKYDIIGPDAETLLQMATTRNVARLSVWRGQYSLICDTTGSVIDDGTLFRLAPDLFRWCCGTEESGRALKKLAEEHDLQVRINDMHNALPNLAIQGPNSRTLLEKISFTQPHVPTVEQLKWFGVTIARLHNREGVPFMLSRTGYTGELGYEIFCSKTDALAVWDTLMQAGEEWGITPMGNAALEILRLEAGLAGAGAEFSAGVNAFEAGLGFAVDLQKSDFVGKQALQRAHDNPAKILRGLRLDCSDVPLHGAGVFAGERPVGVITSAIRSPMLNTTIALARLAIEYARDGTRLEIGQLDGRMKRLSATVCPAVFVDPERTRTRA